MRTENDTDVLSFDQNNDAHGCRVNENQNKRSEYFFFTLNFRNDHKNLFNFEFIHRTTIFFISFLTKAGRYHLFMKKSRKIIPTALTCIYSHNIKRLKTFALIR